MTGGRRCRDGPEDRRGEVGGDEGNVRRGWLRVGWETGWKGGVEDGEIGVEKSVGESVAASIRERRAPCPVVSVEVAEDKSVGIWVSE